MLTSDPNSFSALHRLPSDEIWHFYLGDPVELFELHPDGSSEQVLLGHDVLNGQKVQHIVHEGVWQGSRIFPGGVYALMGTTMASGFTQEDYLGADREDLIEQHPEHADVIRRLTRPA